MQISIFNTDMSTPRLVSQSDKRVRESCKPTVDIGNVWLYFESAADLILFGTQCIDLAVEAEALTAKARAEEQNLQPTGTARIAE